ncbi:MAG: hypothetical protein HY898_10410 [Deltaproteobacteria bacterium]|nr:hypothetical protein [Deltaproteobacteria bacterium]
MEPHPFDLSSLTDAESIARVDALGMIAPSCPKDFGVPAEYALEDINVDISDPGISFTDVAATVTATQGQLTGANGLNLPVQCSGN